MGCTKFYSVITQKILDVVYCSNSILIFVNCINSIEKSSCAFRVLSFQEVNFKSKATYSIAKLYSIKRRASLCKKRQTNKINNTHAAIQVVDKLEVRQRAILTLNSKLTRYFLSKTGFRKIRKKG